MDYNQTSSSNATFKMPLAPQSQYQPSQSEILLFNDIMEEKTLALRNTLNDFLQVHSYRKFDAEFSNFIKHTRRLIIDGQRAGANISRLNNSSQISTIYSRPSGFNCRPSTTMSMISSNRNSTYQMPENDYLPIEPPINPFKPPGPIHLQPKVILPRLEQTNYMSNSFRSPSSNATVIQVCQVTNGTTNTNSFDKSVQPSQSVEKSQSTVPDSYSEVTIIENDESMHVTDSQHNEVVNENNSIESLLENVGFKIVLGLPDNGRITNSINARQHHDKNQSKINTEKYLSMWSINMKKPQMKSSRINLILTGTLLAEDQKTILENNHDAGILESRKDSRKDLVQTKNGVYRLIGSIVSGTPNELYRACLAFDGIPRTWRSIIKPFSGVEKNTKKLMLDFSLDSPAGPIQPTKKVVNHDISMTRKGTVYTKNISLLSKNTTNGKRKYSEYVTENSKAKHSKFHENLPPLLASTPKRPKTQPTIFQTPSQYLKNKMHQNIRNKTSNDTHHQTLKKINDSINITKKRQACSKEQTSILSKSKTPPIKTSLSSKNNTKLSNNFTSLGSVNSTKQSKQTSKNNISIRNSTDCSTQSRNKVLSNTSTMKNSLNSTKQKSAMKNSLNSTKQKSAMKNSLNSTKQKSAMKNSLNSTKQKSAMQNSLNNTKPKLSINNNSTKNRINNSKQVPKSNVKVMKMKQKENITNKESLSASKTRDNKENNKCTKVKQNNKKLKDACANVVVEEKIKKPKGRSRKEKLVENIIQMTPVKLSNKILGDRGLFDDVNPVDFGDISDFNILASPGKFSFVSRTDESRSETPPLFNHQWSTSAKSLAHSEPPTPLSKSVEGKALKRVKAPKITLQEEIKNHKAQTKKQSVDYKTASKKIDKMLEFGESYDDDE